jgi:hypothetical protein
MEKRPLSLSRLSNETNLQQIVNSSFPLDASFSFRFSLIHEKSKTQKKDRKFLISQFIHFPKKKKETGKCRDKDREEGRERVNKKEKETSTES